MSHPLLDRTRAQLANCRLVRITGRVTGITGALVRCRGPRASLGELCRITLSDGRILAAEVVGFDSGQVLVMPLGDAAQLAPGNEIEALGGPMTIRVGPELIGRVVDGLGRPLDGKSLPGLSELPVEAKAPPALSRQRITEPLPLGVRALDGFVTCGKGQRLGIFAGSGVGKSVLMGMIAARAKADVVVVGLVGERGREVREFIERDLAEGARRAVVVVATSDEPPLVRLRAAYVATTLAEYFRDQGQHVLLMLDSLTRVALAQREIGLAAGEPPASKGHVPSLFSLMPRLLERAGPGTKGSITALYTVLVEGDDMNDPVADLARSILDGHITLSRALAHRNHYPAVDVLQSVSRVMDAVVSKEHMEAAGELRRALAEYKDAEDLIRIGAYTTGGDPSLDRAIALMPPLEAFLRQRPDEPGEFSQTREALLRLLDQSEGVEYGQV